jgi:hypothetical protein
MLSKKSWSGFWDTGLSEHWTCWVSNSLRSMAKPFHPRSEDDVRVFLNRTCGLGLTLNDRIDDDLLKGLAWSNPPAFKLRTWRRLSQTLRFLKTFAGQDRCFPTWWLTRTVVGRITCTDPPLQGLPSYVREYLDPGTTESVQPFR